MKSVFYECQ
jgi:hypothetical protein